MANLVQFCYDFVKRKEDPRVENWLFMSSPIPTLTIIGIYLVLILLILPKYMQDRKPFKLTKIIQFYNIFQIVSCTIIIYMVITSGYIQGKVGWGCYPVDYSNDPLAIKLLGAFHWTYFLKMVELVETVFFVLRKKMNQVSYLHVYHHASTFMLAWIGCKFIGGGMASFPIILNSFIHVLMYTYYYLSSLGPEWQKIVTPWKARLTLAQMIQFTILIIHSMITLQPSCPAPEEFLLLYLPNVIIIYKMFYDFYKESYTKKDTIPTSQNNKKIH